MKAEEFCNRYPSRADTAMRLLALCVTEMEVARRVHCDHRTLRELQIKKADEIQKLKEEIKREGNNNGDNFT